MDAKKDFVRIKAKKYDGFVEPETKRFSIDPELTNFKILRETLSKAFNIKGDYVISYLVPRRGEDWSSPITVEDRFLPMLSDWDLNTAVYGASDPQLVLKVDLKPFDAGLEEWDIIEVDDINGMEIKLLEKSEASSMKPVRSVAQRLLGLGGEQRKGIYKQPLNDAEFRSFLDAEGRLLSQQRFRLHVYQGGVEPSLRAVVWRHLLDVYPLNLTGKQRIEYTQSLADKYYCLKDCWQRMLRNGSAETEELRLVANAVRKDVIRTDRHHPFFAGNDENKNVLALFNMLTTYAMCHPDVAYCQGMSDLAAPLLVVMQDEAQAYIAFCALMRRVRRNFLCDGWAMTKKFQHLSELLQYYDPVFYEYLRENHAEDLLFCYRWLLLELKREFTFDDALHVLEVTWASLPPDPPTTPQLAIFEVDLSEHFRCTPFSPPFHVPAMHSLLHLYDTPMNTVSDTVSDSDSESEAGESRPESRASLPVEDMENAEFPFPFSDSEIHMFYNCGRSNSEDHSQKVMVGSAPFRPSIPPLPLDASAPPPNVSSCPSNLNGFCHSALVRQLMLGDGKSSESQLHHHKPSSPLIIPTIVNNGANLVVSDTAIFDDEHVMENNGRVIKQSNEEVVADTSPHSSRANTKNESSPVPVADDACYVADKIKPPKELTLNDVYDICVAQVTVSAPLKSSRSSTFRTRQTSGEAPSNTWSNNNHTKSENGKETSNEPTNNETTSLPTKSRHASSSHKTIPDSGYSGTCTPYMYSVELVQATPPNSKTSSTGCPSQPCISRTSLLSSDVKERCSIEVVNVEKDPNVMLPSPAKLGDGNPFVIFLCLTLLLDHRDRIIKNNMDFNEIAIHFDKLARRHNASKILKNARTLYANYLKCGWFRKRD